MTTRYTSLEQGLLGLIRVLAPLESNFEVNSTFHYRELVEL